MQETIKQLALLEGLEANYRELLAEKETIILSSQCSQAQLLLDLSEELGELKANQKELADYFFDGLIVDWIVQSRINETLDNVKNMINDLSKTLRNLQQELRVVDNRLAEGYKKRQKIIEEYKKEH